MKRFLATSAALMLLTQAATFAQPGLNDAASDHAAIHQAAKDDKKVNLAAARASSEPPQNIAADLLRQKYLSAADKRLFVELVSSPGNPVRSNGQLIFIRPGLNTDTRRTALYVELLRLIGKSTQPPSAMKMARAQIRAVQKLAALASARAAGQPVPGASGQAQGAAAATTSQSDGRFIEELHLTPPTTSSDGLLAVQSIDGTPIMMELPLGSIVGTNFDTSQVDFADKGTCTGSGDSSSSAAYRTAILQCFAHAVHNLRVQAAQDAVREYQKWKRDPYGFTPPSGFSYSAPARPPSDGNGHTLSIAGAYSLDASSAPDVRMYGEADAVNAFIGGADGREAADRIIATLQSSNAPDMTAIRAALGDPPAPDPLKDLSAVASGSAVFNQIKSLMGNSGAQSGAADAGGGLAGAGVMSSETIYDAVMPYASRGFWDAAKSAFTGGTAADEAEAGPPGLVAAFVTTMIEAGVDEGEKVFGNRSLPGDLDSELTAAKAAADPAPTDLAGSQSGRTELFTVYVGGVKHISL